MPASAAAPAWTERLTSQANALVDVYAACLAHAGQKHGNAVKPEDVRALLTTAFIALTKGGSYGA